ncbi:MAG: hypothetical protein WB760_14745 [Xanthobacteraceae bacterium]
MTKIEPLANLFCNDPQAHAVTQIDFEVTQLPQRVHFAANHNSDAKKSVLPAVFVCDSRR